MQISDEECHELKQLFKQAEDAIHRIEPRWNGLAATPINQLRYAGHHYTIACCETDRTAALDQFERARRHCQRAIYDAWDSGLIFLLTDIQDFKNDFRIVPIIDRVPNYPEIQQKAREAKALIDKAKADNETRQAYYEEAAKIYSDLAPMVDTLDDAREELKKDVRAHNRKTVLAWFAIAATFLGGMWAAMGD